MRRDVKKRAAAAAAAAPASVIVAKAAAPAIYYFRLLSCKTVQLINVSPIFDIPKTDRIKSESKEYKKMMFPLFSLLMHLPYVDPNSR